jgi:hypothetical protein
MKKKRNKKYNPVKHAEICTDYALKNLLVAFVTNDDKCILVNKKGELIHLSDRIYRAIAEVKHKWSVYMAAFGEQVDGKPYTKSSEVITSNRHYQYELVDTLNKEHSKLVKNFNHEQFKGAGWLASPVGAELSEEQAFNIFEKLGAFE